MNKKKKRFLIRSVCIIFVVCVVVFSALIIIMTRQTNRTVSYLNNTYMQELNTQMQQKFNSIVKLHLDRVDAIIRRTPPKKSYSEDIMEELKISASVREFSSLGFYMEDGSLDIIYGESFQLVQGEKIEDLLQEDGSVITRGMNIEGDKMLVIGQKASYQLESGKTSLVLMVSIPMEYMNKAMFMDVEDTMTFSNLIDMDGNFIIRNGDIYQQTYFDRLDDAEGKHGEDGSVYSQELKKAMESDQVYRLAYYQNGEKRYAYCAPLQANHNWYLITVMRHGKMEKSIVALDRVRLFLKLGAMLILLVLLLVIFWQY